MRSCVVVLVVPAVLCVSACGTEKKKDGPVDVTGIVVTYSGTPVDGAQVLVGEELVITGVDGTFAFDEVDTPYDLVIWPDCGGNEVTKYEGVTADELRIRACNAGPVRTATVSGGYSPAGGPAESVFASDYADFPAGYTYALGDSTNFLIQTHWWEGATTTGSLAFARFLRTTPNVVDQWVDWGTAEVTVTSGSSLSGVTVTMTPATNAQVEGTVNVPDGYDLIITNTFQRIGDVGFVALNNTTARTFSISSIDAPESTVELRADVNETGGSARGTHRVIVAPDATVTLDPPEGLVWDSVPATLASGAGFAWSGPFDGDAIYNLLTIPPGAGPSVRIWTKDTEATMPRLSPFGLEMLPGMNPIVVFGQGDGGDVDDLIVPPPEGPSQPTLEYRSSESEFVDVPGQ